MFVVARLVLVTVSGLFWNTTRKIEWIRKNTPWMIIFSFLTAVLTLISLVLEIVIKFKVIKK